MPDRQRRFTPDYERDWSAFFVPAVQALARADSNVATDPRCSHCMRSHVPAVQWILGREIEFCFVGRRTRRWHPRAHVQMAGRLGAHSA